MTDVENIKLHVLLEEVHIALSNCDYVLADWKGVCLCAGLGPRRCSEFLNVLRAIEDVNKKVRKAFSERPKDVC